MRQNVVSAPNRGTSDLFGKFLPTCGENQNYAHWELFAAQCCFESKSNIFSFFHIQGLHIFATISSIFVDPPAWIIDLSFP
jgi:hypothetical protein